MGDGSEASGRLVEPFLVAWRRRLQSEERERRAMAGFALAEARSIARMLVERYGARRVYLFGSAARPGGFRATSDIDLAVEGLPPEAFLRAAAEAERETRFPVDLVALEDAGAALRKAIGEEGILLESREGGDRAGGSDRAGGGDR